MKNAWKKLGVVALLTATLLWSLVGGSGQTDKDFKADEAVETLSLKLTLGANGDALEEPVALDLGLGFPLWLHPVGRGSGEIAPFGAVPNQSTANGKVAAGSTVTFTFDRKGEAGLDAFRTTAQLLAGVRVSDIARVGFASPGRSNWQLAAYEITINGKVFVSTTVTAPPAGSPEANQKKLAGLDEKIALARNDLADLKDLVAAKLAGPDDLKRQGDLEKELAALLTERGKVDAQQVASNRARNAQDLARLKLVDVNQQLQPLQEELASIEALITAGLATVDDRKWLEDSRARIALLQTEKVRLEGQLQGQYPWYVDQAFRSPWRAGQSVQSARITLVTHDHVAADTRNYVYFRTGGRSYLLGSPDRPLTGHQGPQVFQLDLQAGPLLAADLRGWAVGMLGTAAPYGRTADRWHPRRVLVEIDGRLVYDSEDSGLDRVSLLSVRLIPPVHCGSDGKLISNLATGREVFLWEAGKGLGLSDQSEILPLPGKDDPNYPLPEQGLPETLPLPGDTGSGFPGEFDIPTDPGTGDIPAPPPGWVPGWWWYPGGWWTPPGWMPPGWWLPPGWDPFPWGNPFQINSVNITKGWRSNDDFQVDWKVSGNEFEIKHYDVFLVEVFPGKAWPFGKVYLLAKTVPPGMHSAMGTVPVADNPHLFLAPFVVGVPWNPAKLTDNARLGPARPVFPKFTSLASQPQVMPIFAYLNGGGGFGPVSFGGEPPGFTRAVWVAGQVESHTGLLFDNAAPGYNLAFRPEPGDTEMRARLLKLNVTGKRRLVAHLAFLGGPGGADNFKVDLTCVLLDPIALTSKTYTKTVTLDSAAPALTLLEQIVDTADIPSLNLCTLRIAFRVSGGTASPAHPPALLGVRLLPVP